MSKIMLFVIMMMWTWIAISQPTAPAISVVLQDPEPFEGETEYSKNLLVNILKTSFSGHEKVSLSDVGPFKIISSVTILSKDATPTVPPLIAMEVVLETVLYGLPENREFHRMEITLKGVGKTENKAYANAFSRLKYAKSKCSSFLNEAADKIVQYYDENCDLIIAKSNQLSQMQNYEAAIATLYAVPIGVGSCWQKTEKASLTNYTALLNRDCKRYLEIARTALATKDYKATKMALMMIDPISECTSEAENVRLELQQETDVMFNRTWEVQKAIVQDKAEIEKERMKAISQVASTYMGSGTGGGLGSGTSGGTQGSGGNINIVNNNSSSSSGAPSKTQVDRNSSSQTVMSLKIVSPNSSRPSGKVYTNESEVNLYGFINSPEEATGLTVNGEKLQWNEQGVFSKNITLQEGVNMLKIKLVGQSGQQKQHLLTVVKVDKKAENDVPESSLVPVREQERNALVIGNSNYEHSSILKNPRNDADGISKALEDLHFKVTTVYDVTYDGLRAAIINFQKKLEVSDVALFYYAGHGLEIDGANYLVPVDAKIDSREDALRHCMEVDRILKAMQYSNDSNLNLLILDACRNNPFYSGKRGGGGLARMTAPSGMLIAYATDPGATASDGNGENGLYTGELINQMKIPQRIEDVFMNTRIQVESKSNGAQRPWEEARLKGVFYLAERK